MTSENTTPITAYPTATPLTDNTQSLPTTYPELAAHFRPIFEEIGAGTVERELNRTLPFAEVKKLDQAGFGTLRVPAAWGGPEASLETLCRLLIDLAAQDSNVAHIYRSHLGFVEALRFQPDNVQKLWYPRILAGATVGNASTEKGGNALGSLNTVISQDTDGTFRLNGTKYYSTATIFSPYTRVSASLLGREGRRFATVPTDASGVTVLDDWDGFGQKLTGTGTTVFDDVEVEPDSISTRISGTPEAIHEAAVFQLVLLSVQAGIARAARDDAASLVASRKRTFNTGLGLPFKDDPLIQEAVGRIAAQAYAAEATVLAVARTLDDGITAAQTAGATSPDFTGDIPQELFAGEIAVENAQITVSENALTAAQQLFLTVGASATSTSKALDRHWRNAQTVATHNPIAFRARSLGDYWINGTLPEGLNAIGDARPKTDTVAADAQNSAAEVPAAAAGGSAAGVRSADIDPSQPANLTAPAGAEQSAPDAVFSGNGGVSR